jgi:hypothetical protein
MNTPMPMPENVPHDQPNPARMYDYFLGGHHNFEVDRRAAEAATQIYPDFPLVMRANRAFLRRAVRFLVAQGIEQFLDLGSGIPTVGNVHEVAQDANPGARVVYVDTDPIAVAHSTAILQGNPNATIIQANAHEPERILHQLQDRHLLNLDQPLGVLLVFLLHFVSDDQEAHTIVRTLRDVLAPGSYLVISHGTADGMSSETSEQMGRLYSRTTDPVTPRPRSEIERFFDGLELVDPGLVYVPLWRPEGPDDLLLAEPERCVSFAGVGRKR